MKLMIVSISKLSCTLSALFIISSSTDHPIFIFLLNTKPSPPSLCIFVFHYIDRPRPVNEFKMKYIIYLSCFRFLLADRNFKDKEHYIKN